MVPEGLVLLTAIPPMLAEGRRVVANIERVARLFVTKTVYAAIIAIAVGAAGVSYPFFPRHLTIISTLTIGIPGFFLALAPGAPLARPGFTRRVLAFTIPAGVAVAAAGLASYAIVRAMTGAAAGPGTGAAGPGDAARTAAMLAVFTMGLWVLGLVAGRPAASRILLIAAMAACLVPLFAVPLARRILALQLPSAGGLVAEAAVVLAAIAALTLWRRFGPPRLARGPGPRRAA